MIVLYTFKNKVSKQVFAAINNFGSQRTFSEQILKEPFFLLVWRTFFYNPKNPFLQ